MVFFHSLSARLCTENLTSSFYLQIYNILK